MKQNLTPARTARTRLASGLLLAATIAGCGFGARQGFGGEPTVTLEFSTFVGSTGCSYATLREATVDSAGNILAVGRGVYKTSGFGGAPVHTYGPRGGGSDIIVVKLKHDGTKMLWVALLGGTDRDHGGYGIGVDANDDVYIAGKTASRDFPTSKGAFDETYNGGDMDAFLCKLRSDGTELIYSTYLGGSKGDSARGGLAIDDKGYAYVAANTFSAGDYLDDATSGDDPGKLNRFTGKIDHPIVKVSPDGKRVECCRFLGDLRMHLSRIALDARGRICLNSWVNNPKMHVSPNAAFPKYRGGKNDGASHIYSNDMQTCLYSTFLGGSGDEIAEHRIAVGRDGTSSLIGWTDSKDFPTTDRAHQRKAGGGGDGYLAKFASDGRPIFITYIGGSGADLPNGPAMDSAGRVFVTGGTTSADFEVTPNAYDSTYGGGGDIFLQIYSPTGQLLYSTFAGGKAADGGRFVTTDANGNPIIVGRTARAWRLDSAGRGAYTAPRRDQPGPAQAAGERLAASGATDMNWYGTVAVLALTCPGLRARAADWPQLQHDAARSGYTKDGPQPPFKHAWNYDFIVKERDKIHPVVQAIICQGRAYVPSKTGRVYAIDAETGERAWRWEKAGPIVSSVGCTGGLVFFGSLDGKVYALRAADGSKAWEFDGGIRGFCTAPCIAEGKVFMGARDGTFYCLEAKTGKKLWATRTGGYVWHTAAYADGRVFVANEEIKALCLDARDGKVLWKTRRLWGFTFRDGTAFVDQGKVVVRTWSAIDDTNLSITKASIQQATDAGRYLTIPAALQDKALNALRREPELRQELFVLDARTGKELYMPVHSGRVSTVDGPAFSVCRDGAGSWYLPVFAGPIAAPWGSTMAFARMDPKTGRLTELLWTPKCKPASNDEAHALSVGGNILYVSEQEEGEAGIFCAFDLTRPLKIGIPTPHMHWDMEYNAQPLANPIAIAGKRFYRITNHILRCWVGN